MNQRAAPPLVEPDVQISRTKCDAPHLVRYVVNWVMWCRAEKAMIPWAFRIPDTT